MDSHKATFRRDLASLTRNITATSGSAKAPIEPQLGNILQLMGEKKLLLMEEKNENFDIREDHLLSDETRDYLNALQTEKLYRCRACYHRDVAMFCEFHARYSFVASIVENGSEAAASASSVTTANDKHYEEFIDFTNSEMGIVERVERYYALLSSAREEAVWRAQAPSVFRKLTGFDGVKALLTHYNCAVSTNADSPDFECMAYE
uniref:Ac34 n=1 Tax=Lymantria dispar multicapsid nuclear polyhedrosis virus TaxID=10449 RepID=A0A1B1MQQ8_NPVLD|nr:hypothetical protein [Lymantria dispar multiple nucleopolyhedrovirus]